MKTETEVNPIDGVHLLRSYEIHCRYVKRGLERIGTDLSERAERHDDSKMFADEFDGFTRINKAAREHPYLSPEYKAGLAAERSTIDLHYSRNSHHPEFHGEKSATKMGFLDIIEMVCDWRGAFLGYGSKGTWEENMARQRERYRLWFTKEQWWLVEQVSAFIVTE